MKILKCIAVAAALLCLAASPALSYERYSYSHGNNTWTAFFDQDDKFGFAINSVPEVKACDSDSYQTFYRTLARAEDAEVLLQTYACGPYIKVCVDPIPDHNFFDPQSCATFTWSPS